VSGVEPNLADVAQAVATVGHGVCPQASRECPRRPRRQASATQCCPRAGSTRLEPHQTRTRSVPSSSHAAPY
jgi:hypothetical protein